MDGAVPTGRIRGAPPHTSILLIDAQKNAVAVAHVKRGKGELRLNGGQAWSRVGNARWNDV